MLLSADKVPLVIPPTTGKSGFFNNETVRSQWAEALRALRSADTVYFVGYSFPPSDTMIRFLVQESHHAERQMIIVNRERAAQDELRKFVPSDSIGDPILGDNSVEELAGRLKPSTNTPEARTLEWEDS
jgi:hypothetical protein